MTRLKRWGRELLLFVVLLAGVLWAMDLWRAPHAPLAFADQPLQTLDGRDVTLAALSAERPLLVYFWASWCGPCLQFSPVFQQVASELEPRLRFVKVDTEQQTAIAARYAIRSIPTLMIFKQGKMVAQRSGSLPPSLFKEWLHSFI